MAIRSSRDSRLRLLLVELQREGIDFAAGRSIVDARAVDAGGFWRSFSGSSWLVLVFNRGRVMVLPQAVNKATPRADGIKFGCLLDVRPLDLA